WLVEYLLPVPQEQILARRGPQMGAQRRLQLVETHSREELVPDAQVVGASQYGLRRLQHLAERPYQQRLVDVEHGAGGVVRRVHRGQQSADRVADDYRPAEAGCRDR